MNRRITDSTEYVFYSITIINGVSEQLNYSHFKNLVLKILDPGQYSVKIWDDLLHVEVRRTGNGYNKTEGPYAKEFRQTDKKWMQSKVVIL